MYYIGIDLGGTNIAIGIVDENYKIVVKGSTPTGADRDGKLVIRDMATLCEELVNDLLDNLIGEISTNLKICSKHNRVSNTDVAELRCNIVYRNADHARLYTVKLSFNLFKASALLIKPSK